MNKKLVTKICTFLLENGIKAKDVYYDWNQIHKELTKIEVKRKRIISESIKCGGGRMKHLKQNYTTGRL